MNIIKIGSQGNDVVLWQDFLKELGFYSGLIDGDFGRITDSATKSFQKKHFLKDDGVVGNKTYSMAYKLGFLTSDCSELEASLFKAHHLPKNEYAFGEGDYQWICLHHTAGWNNPYSTIDSWGRDSRGIVATEFVVGGQKVTDGDSKYDGEILQAFPEGGYGWHLGIGNNFMHRNTIGIELNNFGFLTKGGFFSRVDGKKVFVNRKKDHFYTYVGTEISPNSSQVVELDKEFRGFKFWHKYSDEQIKKTFDLLKYLSERDGIDVRDGLPKLIKEKGIEAFDIVDRRMCENQKGLWSHTNYTTAKTDVFPQQEMIDMLLSL